MTAVVGESIELHLRHLENASDLAAASQAILTTAASFRGEGRTLQQTMEMRNKKMQIVIALVAVAAFLYIVVPLLDKESV